MQWKWNSTNLFESNILGWMCLWQCRHSCWCIGGEGLHERGQTPRCRMWIRPFWLGNNSRQQPGQTWPWWGWERWRRAEVDWGWETLQSSGQFYTTPPNISFVGILLGWPFKTPKSLGWIPTVAIPNPGQPPLEIFLTQLNFNTKMKLFA